ncbi:hypothetical protein I7X12_17375 [Halosimplex litoreum]|uniref:DUF7344 domain-containing protein n=1 Tax=Halosimplex litoreum TaxID=1198301 RepID=A0A7T3FXA3_9EURY|nr:hypothetical protein [Halosimplex litoreum]QPV62479.1 hypothetical protein I7X12_17375 [Halosimplex litoreum]
MSDDRNDGAAEMIERWNSVFRSLAAEPHRQMVVALLEAPPDRELSLPEAANPPYLPGDPEKLYVELVHSHLPALAEHGFVEWDREPLRVRRGPAFEEVAVVFEALHAHADEIPVQLTESCQRLEERREGCET